MTEHTAAKPGKLPARVKQGAQFALLTPLVTWGIIIFLRGTFDESRALAFAFGVVVLVLLVAGLVMSVVSLCLIPKYGRKGLLGYGFFGLLLNLLMLVLLGVGMVIGFQKGIGQAEAKADLLTAEQADALPVVTPGSLVIYDAEHHYRVEIPPGFTQSSPPGNNTQFSYYFTRPFEDGSQAILTIEHFPKRISHERATPEVLTRIKAGLPAGSSDPVARALQWQNIDIDAIDMFMPNQEDQIFVSMVQLPLLPKAIQIGVMGLPEHKQALQNFQQQTCQSLIGKAR